MRAHPDDYDYNMFSLVHMNSRVMDLVCSGNYVKGMQKKSFIRYRIFYNEVVNDFIIESNAVCHELMTFLNNTYHGIDTDTPLKITLNKKSQKVEKVIYPSLDPYADTGLIKHLFKKPDIRILVPDKKIKRITPKQIISSH